jgi:plastocyanin
MSQPVYAIRYLGTVRVVKNTQYTTASLLASFAGATVAKLSTDVKGDGVGITVNNTPMAIYYDGEEQYIQAGDTFEFSKECTMKIGVYKAVV